MAVVLRLGRYQDRRTLQGTAVSADTGKAIRSGMVALEPAEPAPETLRALGMFLVAGKEAKGLIIQPGSANSASVAGNQPHRDSGSSIFSTAVLKWVSLGAGSAALGTGIALIAIDGKGTCEHPTGGTCPQRYETLPAGIAVASVGGAALLTAGVLFYLDARRPGGSQRTALIAPAALPGGAALTAVGSF
jgi:hypothetical protein